MSNTPETDAEEGASYNFAELVVPSGLARKLERERDKACEKIKRQMARIRKLEGPTNHAGGLSKRFNATKAKFKGSFDMFLSRGYLQSEKFTVLLKRSKDLLAHIDKAEPNQLLWDSKLEKLYFLNSERALFQLAFLKVEEGAK